MIPTEDPLSVNANKHHQLFPRGVPQLSATLAICSRRCTHCSGKPALRIALVSIRLSSSNVIAGRWYQWQVQLSRWQDPKTISFSPSVKHWQPVRIPMAGQLIARSCKAGRNWRLSTDANCPNQRQASWTSPSLIFAYIWRQLWNYCSHCDAWLYDVVRDLWLVHEFYRVTLYHKSFFDILCWRAKHEMEIPKG